MSLALQLLLELLVFIGFGLLFYYFQKRKIMRNDAIEIMEILDEVIRQEQDVPEANDFLDQLAKANHERNYPKLLELIQATPKSLSTEGKEILRDLDDRIAFHLK